MELIVGRDSCEAFPRGFINRTDVRIEKSSLFGDCFGCRNYSAMKAIAKLVTPCDPRPQRECNGG